MHSFSVSVNNKNISKTDAVSPLSDQMAAYFHGNPPDISAATDGGLQTLVLMNPTTYVQYSDNTQNPQHTHTNNHLVFLNSHAPPHTSAQQFVGIPLSGQEHDNLSAMDGGFIPRVHYNLYNNSHEDPTQQAARETPHAQQGLSLTLSSQQQQTLGLQSGEEIRVGSGLTSSGVTNSVSGLISSKYLKAAQELLDEVVNVNNNNNNIGIINSKSEIISKNGSNSNNNNYNDKITRESSAGAGDGSAGGEAAAGKRANELTTAERQEIQMKKAKLISMLDEVDQRYRQYHQQMQIVMSQFEQAAGTGSAKAYTSLALKTISKQFRCLKDAIAGQIKAANKSLGEEESSSGGKMEGSRLKFVDYQLRQQRALQQLGMIQHHTNAWRPQRGLPERAVSVLRAWLFDHFLHPYPKDSDKHMLAKQTGLTRSQVSNWFINARVRLWKPMVEEMYVEEMKEREKNGSMETTEQNNEDSLSKSTNNQDKNPVKENHQLNNNHHTPSFTTSSALLSSELEGITTQGRAKRLRSNDHLMPSPPSNVMAFNNNDKLGPKIIGSHQNDFMGSFGQYPVGEIPRFDEEQFTQRFQGNNNGVSLTLGLPHCDNLSGTHHQSFLPSHSIHLGRRVDQMGEPNEFGSLNTSSTAHSSSSSAYDHSINIQNQKRFVVQLLPDFVT